MQKELRTAGLVTSSQKSIHPGLARMVKRHMLQRWRQPIHKATQESWNRLKLETGFATDTAFVLDSGCGTGTSTRRLTALHPNLIVLGIDQSHARLSKNGVHDGLLVDGNVVLLRAELSSVWRLMLAEGFHPRYHYLFYPNPWPKSGQLKRRWHGHPVFPDMLALGGDLEMRCNWRIYAREFAAAASLVCGQEIAALPFTSDNCISPFEEKYVQREHDLFAVNIPAATLAAFARIRTVQEELSSSSAAGSASSAGGGV